MRATDWVRLSLGTVLLLRPAVAAHLAGTPATGGVTTVTRVLGARYVVQSAVSAKMTHPWGPTGDVVVEGIHAASMLALSHARPDHRRLALLSAAVATGFAIADGQAGLHP